jgi:hypothetical protein
MQLAKIPQSHIKYEDNPNLNKHYYRQPDGYSCGATSVKIISLIYNTVSIDIEELKKICNTNPNTGTIETGIMAGLNKLNLPYQRTNDVILTIEQDEIYLDSILKNKFSYIMRTMLYNVKHWIVVYDKIEADYYLCLDPSAGIVSYHKDFILKAHELRQFDGFTILKGKN